MHFNFHLDGTESSEQIRRISNAVLALGGMNPKELVAEIKLDGDSLANTFREIMDEKLAGLTAPNEIRNVVDPQAFADFANAKNTSANFSVEPDGSVRVEMDVPKQNITRHEAIPGSALGAQWHEEDEPAAPVGGAPSDLDKNGLPWDERIHSSSRAKNADGSWRAKRGVAAGFVTEVENELRALMAGKFDGIQVPPPPPAIDTEPRTVPATPPMPPIPQAMAEGAPTPYTYANVVNLIASKKLQPEVYVAILGESLPDFAKTCGANPAAAGGAYEKLSNL